MTILSAYEDFLVRTLDAVPALLEKLLYVSCLRNEAGEYEHWGMVHVHGEESARRAMETAHSELFLRVLRTPLRQLAEDCAVVNPGEPRLDLENCRRNWQRLLPQDEQGGNAEHLRSVLTALAKLQTAPSPSTRQAA
jgi:hypothetical protein